jgi:dTMP kinase
MNALVSGQVKYIVFDGIDGGGKGSVIQKIMELYPSPPKRQSLEEVRCEGIVGKYVDYVREPGGTEAGERLRSMLLNEKLTSDAEMYLFLAQRSLLRKTRVEPALFSGLHVISDRSDSATFAYQIRGRELAHLENLFWETRRGMAPHPSLYIIFDISPVNAAKRMAIRGEEADNFEKQGVAFFERVSNGYREFARNVDSQCVFVNAERGKEEVMAECLAIVEEHIGKRKQPANGTVVPISSATKRA